MARKDEQRKRSEERKADVVRDLARLKGQSTSELMRDQDRGPVSSLGYGSNAKPAKKGRR
jgi:hypothetical protein